MRTSELDTTRLERFIEHPKRAVWTVALPMMAGMGLHVVYNVVDTAFVGRLGPQALAGMTLVFPLFFVLIALASGIGTGIGVLVSQAVGRRDAEAAERAAGTAISFGVVLGLGFTAAGLLTGKWLLRQLGASEAADDFAWSYFSIIVLAAPLTTTGSFLRFVLTGEGDARTPMLVMAASTVLNIVLDPLLIFTAGLGIGGAALATAIAQALSLAIYAWLLLHRRRNVVQVRVRHMWPRWSTVRQVLRLGVPASLSQLTMAVAAMLINAVVARFGDHALAGYGAANRVDHIVAMPLFGLSGAAVAVIGMFAGASRVDLVRSVAGYVLRWAVAIALVVGTTAWVAGDHIMRIFTSDPATVAIGSHYLSYMVLVYPMMGFGMASGRMLLGLGYAGLSLALTSIRLLVVGVPVAYVSVLVFQTPIDGVWRGILCGAVVSTCAAALFMRRFVWRRDPTVRATA